MVAALFCRNADAGIFHIKFYKTLFIEKTEMDFSFRGKFNGIAKQVAYDLYRSVPVSGYECVGISSIQNQLYACLGFMDILLF